MKNIPNSEYRPGAYARLSDEDNRAGTSLSIENQLKLIRKFCKDNGFAAPKVFFDDDKTGTDFNRQGFQDMYAEAKAGNIDLLIIKDTSRFGRNWVQSGVYFEKIEDMGVRFISIQEGIDTIDPKCPALKMLPFYFIFNEWHSQTTSEKIKAVYHQMALDGEYTSTTAPYGYLKDPDNKHRLIIDPYASQIVKRIYEMRLQKQPYSAIISVLNAENILAPGAYAIQTQNRKDAASMMKRDGKWGKDSLCRIFQNIVYMGDVANGKNTSVSYKNHRRKQNPMSEWIIVKNVHTPIVSREDWQACYDLTIKTGRVRQTKEKEIMPFSGLVFCRDCGCKLRHGHTYFTTKSGERKKSGFYNCANYISTAGDICSSHYISEKDIISIVCDDIRAKARGVICDEDAARKYYVYCRAHEAGTQLKSDEKTLKQTQKRLSELDRLIQAAFEKSVLSNTNTFTEFLQKYETEKIELVEKVRMLTAKIKKQNQSVNDIDAFMALIRNFGDNIEGNITLDRMTAVKLIEKITVSSKSTNPREIEIYYNFIGKL